MWQHLSMHASPVVDIVNPPLAGKSERHAWYVVFLMFLGYMLSFVDRQILTLLVDPISHDLGLTDTQFSLLHGMAFALFYTFLGLPCGWLVDRYDRRLIAGAGIAVWSAMTMLCGSSRVYWHLFLTRMGVGVGEATLSPAALSMLSDLFSKERLPRAASVYAVGIAVGSGVALLFGGYVVALAASVGGANLPLLRNMHPWQIVFLLVGVIGFPLAIAVLCLKDPPRRGLASGAAVLSVGEVAAFVRSKPRLFTCLLLGLSIATALGHGVLGWVPAYFTRVYHWTPEQVGLRYGLCVIVFGSGGLMFGSWLTERFRAKGRLDGPVRASAIGIALCAPLGIAAPLVHDPMLSLFLFALLQFAYMMPWGIAGAAFQLVAPNQMRGQLSGLYFFSINIIGLGVGPTLVALLTDNVFGGGAGVAYSLAVAAALLAPVASLLLFAGLRAYEQGVIAARAWSGP